MPENFESSVFRIIDAAANRAAEGLRVVEDFARMHKEDASLARELKQLRHSLTTALAPIDSATLLQARDPASDVGTTISTSSEFERADFSAIVRSNFARVLQSLRTMEEYSKFLSERFDESIAPQLEQLRYQTYIVEKAVFNTVDSQASLNDVMIYVLTDSRGGLSEFESLIGELIRADVGLIQLRDKSLDDRELLRFGKRLTELTRDVRTRWIMNDRPDLARLADADGVHVGQEDVSVHQARQIVGPGKLIGVSTHDIDQARAAEIAGANYIGVGPCFPSGTKQFNQFVPTEFLSTVSSEILVPAFAIGGIDASNVATLNQLGIGRVAVSKSLVESHDKSQDAGILKKALRVECMASDA